MNEAVPHIQVVPSVTTCRAVFVVVVTICTLPPSPSWAQTQPEQSAVTPQQFVDRNIEQLGSDLLAAREQAKQELLNLGPSVLQLLPPDRDVDDAQTRSSLNLIRQRLWKQKAIESIQASTVPVANRQTIGQLIQSLKRSGNRFEVDLPQSVLDRGLKQSDAAAAAGKSTFWQVLRELERQASVAVQVGGSPPLLRLSASKSHQPWAISSTGPFRIEVTSVDVRNVIGRDDASLLRIRFSLTTEPRLRPLFLVRNGRSLSVQFAGGIAPPFSPEAHLELPLGQGGMQVDFHADFLIPMDQMPESIDIDGSWQMQLSGGSEPFRFPLDESAAGTRRQKAGVTVGLEQIARMSDEQGTRVDVVMSVSYRESGPAFESHRNWLGKNDIRLEDKEGNRIAAERMDIELQIDGSAWVRYRFRPQKQLPVFVVYSAPTLITETRIPVRFTGLSLTER